MKINKFAAFLAILMLAFTLTACGGDDNDATMDDDAAMIEDSAPAVDDSAMEAATVNTLTDEEFLATVRELVDLLAKMQTMNSDEAGASMSQLMVLSGKLQGFDDTHAKELLESEPELKAAIEALNSVQQ